MREREGEEEEKKRNRTFADVSFLKPRKRKSWLRLSELFSFLFPLLTFFPAN